MCVEAREGDERVVSLLSAVIDDETSQRCEGERAFLRALEGGCQVPIAISSEILEGQSNGSEVATDDDRATKKAKTDGKSLKLVGRVFRRDGTFFVEGEVEGPLADSVALGEKLAVSA